MADSTSAPSQYWCNYCSKYVSIDSILGSLICQDCRHTLPDFISAAAPPPPPPDQEEYFRFFHLMDEAGREDTPPPPSPPPPPSEIDYIRLDLGGWEIDGVVGIDSSQRISEMIQERNHLGGFEMDGVVVSEPSERNNEIHQEIYNIVNENINLDGWDMDGVVRSDPSQRNNEILEERFNLENENSNPGGFEIDGVVGSDPSDNNNEINHERYTIEGGQRRRRPFVLRPVIENGSRRRRRRQRVVGWADYFYGVEENEIEVRLQLPEGGTFFGNPGDYVDEVGYEAFLRVLAEGDSGGDRGAPPAGKAVVVGLETEVISDEEGMMVCAVCRESVNAGELMKKLPCRHVYHGDCIVKWLELRNSCPVCRFELPTDDPEYEIERKKKLNGGMDGIVAGSTSTAPVGEGGGSGSGGVQSFNDSINLRY